LAFLKKGHSSNFEEYGYIFKITAVSLVFYETEKLKSASPTKIFNKKDLSRINLSEKTSQKYKAVQVSYHNPKTGKTVKTTVKNPGVVNGDTLKISARCENKQQAILKAKAAITKGDTGIEGSIELIGNQYLVAGINIELKGIGHFSGKYHVTQARHKIDKSVGFKTALEVKSC
jgi:phage protein D